MAVASVPPGLEGLTLALAALGLFALYLAYASRVGRFAPGLGTLRPKGERP